MDKLFEKYRKRLMCIGIFKSVMISLSVALILTGVVAVITWLTKASMTLTLSLTLGIGFAVFVALSFLLYFKHFRPTPKMVAQQLDALGNDERYITMLECENNPSLMANLQREDAKTKLSGISLKSLKFTLALPVVLVLVFGFIFAAGTTTVSMLTVANVIGSEETETLPPETVEMYTVTYKVYQEGTGTISGQLTQTVEKGRYTKEVMAVPAEGYRFTAWVDKDLNRLANQTNPRAEVNVREDMVIYALFEKINPGDQDEDVDGELGKGEEDQNPEKDDGDGDENEGSVGGNESGQGSSGDGEGEGRQNNKVIDGTQDYKDKFDREQLEKELADKDVPDELKDILGDYYGTIKP